MKKKKVVIIIPSLRGGGAERVMANIVRHLDKEKFEIKLMLLKKEGSYINLIPDYVAVIDLDVSRARYAFIKLIKELNRYRPHTIMSTLGHLNLSLLILKPLLKGKPKIIVREANTPSRSMNKLNPIKKKIYYFLTKKLYPKADLIIAQCKDMKKDIIDCYKIQENQIKYIYNPLDLEMIQKKMIEENPYDMDKVNFVATGRLTYQKGFDILIDAFTQVRSQIENAHLTIVGQGELEQELKEQARNLGLSDNITFAGFKDNPYPYYYYADTYVLSSRWEGFPNSLLEALACHTKVVATDCKTGPREILKNNKYGILVKENDPKLLSEGMVLSSLGANKTHNRAIDFKIDNIIKEYESIL